MKRRRRCRVLIVETGSGLGGSARALGEMLRGFDGRRFDATVLFTKPDAASDRMGSARILKTARAVGRSPRRWPADMMYLRRMLRDARPDVVHLNNELYSSVPVILAAALMRIPVVCHLRSQRRPTRIERLLAPLCRRLVAISFEGQKYFRRRLAGAGRKIEMVQDSFVRIPERLVKRGMKGSVTIGMTSNLVRGKGHETVISAMPRIMRAHPEARLKIAGCAVGDGSYAEELRERVGRLGLGGAVEFAGWVDDIAGFLRGVDILVDASRLPEGYRHTIVEAMQAGAAVVASATGPVREIIRSQAEGVIVPPADSEAIAEAVCMLLDNPRVMREMARTAREAAVSRFQSREGIRRMGELYREAALSRRV
jgi:glycosyltransferase involved in cell wall biosynthesis